MVTTRWTMVLSAGADGPEGQTAFEAFCRTYWYPIYAFIRRQGRTPEDAQDLTQEFFARLVERNWLADVERGETRFSTLLLTILKNFLINAHEHAAAQKRGGGRAPLSIDQAQAEEWFGAEPVDRETPERTFERRWALALLDAATRRLRAEMESAGKTCSSPNCPAISPKNPAPAITPRWHRLSTCNPTPSPPPCIGCGCGCAKWCSKNWPAAVSWMNRSRRNSASSRPPCAGREA